MNVVEQAPKINPSGGPATPKKKAKKPKSKSAINDLSEKVVQLLLTMSLDDLEEKLHKRKLKKKSKPKKKEFDYDNKDIFASPQSDDTKTFKQSKSSVKKEAKGSAPKLEKGVSGRPTPERLRLGPAATAPPTHLLDHSARPGPSGQFPISTSVEQIAADKPSSVQRPIKPAAVSFTAIPPVIVVQNVGGESGTAGAASFPQPTAPPAVLDANTRRASTKSTPVESRRSSASSTPVPSAPPAVETSSRRSSASVTPMPSAPPAPEPSSRRSSANATPSAPESRRSSASVTPAPSAPPAPEPSSRRSSAKPVPPSESTQRRSSAGTTAVPSEEIATTSGASIRKSSGAGNNVDSTIAGANSEPVARKSSAADKSSDAALEASSSAPPTEKRKSGPTEKASREAADESATASNTAPVAETSAAIEALSSSSSKKTSILASNAPPAGAGTRKSPPLPPASKASSKASKKAAKRELKSIDAGAKIGSSTSNESSSVTASTNTSASEQDDDPILRHILESLDDPVAMYDLLDNPEYVERLEQLILSTPSEPVASFVPMAGGKPIFRGMTKRRMQNAAQVMWGRLSRISEGENEDSDSATLSSTERISDLETLADSSDDDDNEDDEDDDDDDIDELPDKTNGTDTSTEGKKSKSITSIKGKGNMRLNLVRSWIRKRHAKVNRSKEKKSAQPKLSKAQLSTIEEDDVYSDIDDDEAVIPIKLNKSAKSPVAKPSPVDISKPTKKESTKKLTNVKKWLHSRTTGAKQAELQKQALAKIQKEIQKRKEEAQQKAAAEAKATLSLRPLSKAVGSVPASVKPSVALDRSRSSSPVAGIARASAAPGLSARVGITPVAAAASRVGVALPGVSGVKLINSKVPIVISAHSMTQPSRFANKHTRKIVKVGPGR